MKGEGFRLLGWQWGAGRVKERNTLTFNQCSSKNPKVWASTLECCIIHLPCAFLPISSSFPQRRSQKSKP